MKFNLKSHLNDSYQLFRDHIVHISSHTMGWIALILMHISIIPTLLAVLTGFEARVPVDYVLLVYGGLFLFFIKATISKDILNIVTIGFGFFIQSCIMALIIFK